MAKRRRETTEKSIEQRLKEGRGQGTGAEYQPWLRIQDVPSQGLVHRIKGWKTGRVHHLLSKLELAYFLILEWSPHVVDIREQYPLLPLAETVALAETCGVRHPSDPVSQVPVVMTTDFLVTLAGKQGPVEQARSIKPVAALAKQRTREKLEIERRYWSLRRVDWGIVTEREIPRTLANNLELLRSYWDLSGRLALEERQLKAVEVILATYLMKPDLPLREAAARCDQRLELEAGTSLTAAYHLLATRQWQTDLNHPLDPAQLRAIQTGSTLRQVTQKGTSAC